MVNIAIFMGNFVENLVHIYINLIIYSNYIFLVSGMSYRNVYL